MPSWQASLRLKWYLNLDSLTLTGLPGDVVDLSGTIQNDGNTDVFLNELDVNLFPDPTANETTIDTSPFYFNFPTDLQGGDSASGVLAEFTLGPGETIGNFYEGEVDLLGGADGNASDASNTQYFTLTIAPPTSTPEPSTEVFMVVSAFVGFCHIRRSRASA